MLFYVIIILSATFFAGLADFTKRFYWLSVSFFILSASILVVPLAMRGMGVDYDTYITIYHKCSAYSLKDFMFSYSGFPEPLYALLNFTVYHLFHNFQGVNISCAGLSIGFSFAGIWKFRYKIHLTATIFSFCFFYYLMMYGLNRMMIAVSIITWAYHYYGENKIKLFMLWTVVAGGFHYSALLMIPFYFLLRWIETKQGNTDLIHLAGTILGITAVFILIYLIVPRTFGLWSYFSRYQNYFVLSIVPEALNNNVGSFLLLMYLFFCYKSLLVFLRKERFLVWMMMVFLCVSLISIIIPVHRICYLFFPAVSLLYGVIPRWLSMQHHKYKNINIMIYYTTVLFVGMILLYRTLMLSSLWSPFLVPYYMGNYF